MHFLWCPNLLILVDGNILTVKDEERIIAPLYDIEIETGVQISARILLKKIWENRPFKTPFYVNVVNEGVRLWKNNLKFFNHPLLYITGFGTEVNPDFEELAVVCFERPGIMPAVYLL